MLADYRTAPIDDQWKALFAFIERMNAESHTLQPADIAKVKEAGWSEEAIYDAITVCALFNFYNKWIDATGVSDLPAASYAMRGLASDSASSVRRMGGCQAPPARRSAHRSTSSVVEATPSASTAYTTAPSAGPRAACASSNACKFVPPPETR